MASSLCRLAAGRPLAAARPLAGRRALATTAGLLAARRQLPPAAALLRMPLANSGGGGGGGGFGALQHSRQMSDGPPTPEEIAAKMAAARAARKEKKEALAAWLEEHRLSEHMEALQADGVKAVEDIFKMDEAAIDKLDRPKLLKDKLKSIVLQGGQPEGGGAEAEAAAAAGGGAVAVQHGLVVVEKADWEKNWEKAKKRLFQGRIFEHFNSASEKMDDFIEESDNPVVNMFRRARHAVFGETEHGLALKEIKRLDPEFDPYDFPTVLEEEILTPWIEAYLGGGGDPEAMEVLQQYCTERMLITRILPYFKQHAVEFRGLTIDDRLLHLSPVEMTEARIVDGIGPVLSFTFHSQEINCRKNAEGEVVFGAEDNIMDHAWVWMMVMDEQDEPTPEGEDEETYWEENPRGIVRKWKLEEFQDFKQEKFI